jgi:N-acetylglutamate synthase-like GNAT family acetyltransferase
MSVVTRRAHYSEILALRHSVLQSAQPIAAAGFDGDVDESTIHLGSFVDGRAVGCVTLLRSQWRGEAAWQLRGLAVEPIWQRSGIGSELLSRAQQVGSAAGPRLFWCDAPAAVACFFLARGWKAASEPSGGEDFGSHTRMIKRAEWEAPAHRTPEVSIEPVPIECLMFPAPQDLADDEAGTDLATHHAPVLLIPDVIGRALCRDLIETWRTQGHEDSGFMTLGNDGQTIGRFDYSRKIRRDHFLGRGPLHARVKDAVSRVVIPAVRRAFQFRITRYEDFRVVNYDAGRGGYFRAHVDNTTPATAHRRFAMTLNLNAEEYEGGCLRFPEYGPLLYKPPTCSAVVFSCSLLHEATGVTRGSRFALLSFFYDEAAARLREANSRKAGGGYHA